MEEIERKTFSKFSSARVSMLSDITRRRSDLIKLFKELQTNPFTSYKVYAKNLSKATAKVTLQVEISKNFSSLLQQHCNITDGELKALLRVPVSRFDEYASIFKVLDKLTMLTS
jgi:hypothetical protein